MENKSVKLLELFNVDSDKYSDLDGLNVLKVDIYKTKAAINLVLDGVDSLKDNNSLVAFVEELERDFGTKVNLTFRGFDFSNLSDAYDRLSHLIKYYISRDNAGSVSNIVDFITFRADIDHEQDGLLAYITQIDVASGWLQMLSTSDREDLIRSVRESSLICTGNDIPASFEIVCSNVDVPGSDFSLEDDILRAIESGKLEFPEEEVIAEPAKNGKKKKASGDKKADPEAKADKGSWTFKPNRPGRKPSRRISSPFTELRRMPKTSFTGK